MSRFKNIIAKFARKHIMVIGDVILDRYIQGNVSRISPEAPVPVVLEDEFFYTPGGAANVSHNLRSLGAKVTQVGRIGNDFEGQILKRTLKNKGVNISGIFADKSVPTITKTRVIAKHQQVVRIDREKLKSDIERSTKKKIFHFIEQHIKDVDAVIISDYGKGFVTAELLNLVKTLAAKHKTVVTVDPKVEHFRYYEGVTAITPNLYEAQNAIRNIKITDGNAHRLKLNRDKLEKDEDVKKAGRELLKYLDIDALLITMGEQGMRLFEKNKTPVLIKTKAREVFDVSGAGDTVISVFTLVLTTKATKRKAAELANIAAGVVVGKMGAVAITKKELLEAS